MKTLAITVLACIIAVILIVAVVFNLIKDMEKWHGDRRKVQNKD